MIQCIAHSRPGQPLFSLAAEAVLNQARGFRTLAGRAAAVEAREHDVIVTIGPSPPAACRTGYRLGSDRGSPNHGSTLLSKRVMAQTRSPVRVRT